MVSRAGVRPRVAIASDGRTTDSAVGYVAFGLLLALIASVLLGTAYAARLWRRRPGP